MSNEEACQAALISRLSLTAAPTGEPPMARQADPIRVRSVKEAFDHIRPVVDVTLSTADAGTALELRVSRPLRRLADFNPENWEYPSEGARDDYGTIGAAAAKLEQALASFDIPRVASAWADQNSRSRILEALRHHVDSDSAVEEPVGEAVAEIFSEIPLDSNASLNAYLISADPLRCIAINRAFSENVQTMRTTLDRLMVLRAQLKRKLETSLKPLERAYRAINVFFATAGEHETDPSEPSLVLFDLSAIGETRLPAAVASWLERTRRLQRHRPICLVVPLLPSGATSPLAATAHEADVLILAEPLESQVDPARVVQLANEAGLRPGDYICPSCLQVTDLAPKEDSEPLLISAATAAAACLFRARTAAFEATQYGPVLGARAVKAGHNMGDRHWAGMLAGSVSAAVDANRDIVLRVSTGSNSYHARPELPEARTIAQPDRASVSTFGFQVVGRAAAQPADVVEELTIAPLLKDIVARIDRVVSGLRSSGSNTELGALSDVLDDLLHEMRVAGLIRRYRLSGPLPEGVEIQLTEGGAWHSLKEMTQPLGDDL